MSLTRRLQPMKSPKVVVTDGLLVLLTAALLMTGACPTRVADLAKIDRIIAKQPAYQSKHPRYCLLVFGAEAKARVWIVLDGEDLYVDRNGDGDLTEPGERVRAQGTLGISN